MRRRNGPRGSGGRGADAAAAAAAAAAAEAAPTPPPSAVASAAAAAVVGAVAAGCYLPSLANQFAFDDRSVRPARLHAPRPQP